MIKIIGRLLNKKYHFLNRIEISRENLIHNYNYLSELNPKIKIAPVLKSNAYGHGLVEVAQVLDSVGVPFFCVDSLHEAYHLYKAKIKTPILIMGYINPENLKVKSLPFSYAVFNLEMLQIISKYQPRAEVHLFVDTGMNREGITIDDLPNFLLKTRELKVNITGIMSHLASAENPNDQITQTQIKNFQTALKILEENKLKIKWQHLFASKAIMQSKNYPKMEKYSNLARVGMASFGIDPVNHDQNLKPVLKLITHIAQIKRVKKGASIGYNETFKAKRDLTIGILPIGYNDGVDRRLSNTGVVSINQTFCPIIGKVSMNITTIDLSNVQNPNVGQEVVIFSSNPADKNSIKNSAKTSQTIPYEILVHLHPSTKRVVV